MSKKTENKTKVNDESEDHFIIKMANEIQVTDNLRLKPWHTDMADRLQMLANDVRVAKWLTDKFPHPYTLDHAHAFIKFASDTTSHHEVFAILFEDELIGGIGLHPLTDIFAHNAELGYWIAPPYWGKGFMTKCVDQIVKYGFQSMGIERIFARPFGDNIGSQKVLEHCKFQQEAVLKKTIKKWGEYKDEIIYSRWKD